MTSKKLLFGAQVFLTSCLMVVLAIPGPDSKERRAECLMWSKLENKTLPLQDQGHAECSTNQDCTGFDCKGLYQGKDISFGMRVLSCRTKPGVQIYGSAPQFNTKNFSHVFEHESEYTVPGSLLNFSLLPGAEGLIPSAKLQVHIQRNPDRKTIMMGLVMKACLSDGECPFQKPIFNHTEIPVPECSSLDFDDPNPKSGSVCRMSDLDSCGPNQTCLQEGGNDDVIGICQCLPGFARTDDGDCISKEKEKVTRKKVPSQFAAPSAPVQPVEEDNLNAKAEPNSDVIDDSEEIGGGAVAAIVIAVIIIVVLAGGAIAYVVLRTRLAPRLRAALTQTPYEDIVIGKQGRSESRQNVIA